MVQIEGCRSAHNASLVIMMSARVTGLCSAPATIGGIDAGTLAKSMLKNPLDAVDDRWPSIRSPIISHSPDDAAIFDELDAILI